MQLAPISHDTKPDNHYSLGDPPGCPWAGAVGQNRWTLVISTGSFSHTSGTAPSVPGVRGTRRPSRSIRSTSV